MTKHIGDLPRALENGGECAVRLARKHLAVFLDHDGTTKGKHPA